MASTAPNLETDTITEFSEDELDRQPYYVTPEDGRRMFDEAAHKLVGISGEEFLQRYDAGKYKDVPDTEEYWHIGRLIMLIPLARQ